MSLMRLGKEKYDIHCAICHGEYGAGKGVVSTLELLRVIYLIPLNLAHI